MKRIIFTLLATLIVFGLLSGASFAQEEDMPSVAATRSYSDSRNQVSFSFGVYYPSEDMDDEFDADWENGADLTATYTRLIGNHFAFEGGYHAYGSTFDEGAVEGAFVSTGLEAMFLYVPLHGRVMAYVGGGLGLYSNYIEVEVNGTTVLDDEGSAAGAVLKGGVRAHITKRFYVGGFLKAFSNNQEFEYENGDEETINMGGSTVNFELGFAF